MRRTYLLLITAVLMIILSNSALADDDDDDDDDEEILGFDGEDAGEIALYLMIASLLIVVWKPTFMWLRKNGPERFDVEPREFKRKLGTFNRRFMKVHTWIGIGAAIVGTLHGLVLDWHWTLWVAMGSIWLLVISGLMMQWKWPPREFRKGARLLHLQRTFALFAVTLLIIGHEIVD